MQSIVLNIESIRDGETFTGIEYDFVTFSTLPGLDCERLESALQAHFRDDMLNFNYCPQQGTGDFILLCTFLTVGERIVPYTADITE
ncbi:MULTISPECIES: hypothetical protein [Enterobacterales]|uniref:hypothetical protein n=1 Tax=Enterobacterales TaxID=91347 RepID=UPI000DD3C767|nr:MULTISPECIES: hypothetical protein [Enterobacterales]MBZ7421887.1 hypothetical protein [Klebsiella michiganensis]CAH0304416.1 hypothetical protein SRABI106_03858 [Rahnella aquatilis]